MSNIFPNSVFISENKKRKNEILLLGCIILVVMSLVNFIFWTFLTKSLFWQALLSPFLVYCISFANSEIRYFWLVAIFSIPTFLYSDQWQIYVIIAGILGILSLWPGLQKVAEAIILPFLTIMITGILFQLTYKKNTSIQVKNLHPIYSVNQKQWQAPSTWLPSKMISHNSWFLQKFIFSNKHWFKLPDSREGFIVASPLSLKEMMDFTDNDPVYAGFFPRLEKKMDWFQIENCQVSFNKFAYFYNKKFQGYATLICPIPKGVLLFVWQDEQKFIKFVAKKVYSGFKN